MLWFFALEFFDQTHKSNELFKEIAYCSLWIWCMLVNTITIIHYLIKSKTSFRLWDKQRTSNERVLCGNVVLLCARGVRQIFSDDSLYHNDSKRVREKVFQNEAEPSFEKKIWTSFESLWYRDESEKICLTTRAHCNVITFLSL